MIKNGCSRTCSFENFEMQPSSKLIGRHGSATCSISASFSLNYPVDDKENPFLQTKNGIIYSIDWFIVSNFYDSSCTTYINMLDECTRICTK